MKTRIIALILILVFLFTRFYKINTSLYFYNDMGRDLLALFDWIKSGKIPLLGPQTSALPISQSPIYYYFLMPIYLISGKSPYTALILNAIFYLTSFILIFFLTWKDKNLNKSSLVIFILTIFQPQYILQNRYVWNPSLLPPIITLSLILFLLDKKHYLLFSLFLVCLAISIHFSAIPILISYFLVIFLFKKQYLLKTLFLSVIFTFVLNITTFLQLAKRFILTRMLWQNNQVFQVGSTLGQKINQLQTYAFGTSTSIFSFVFATLILLLLLYSVFFHYDQKVRIAAIIFLTTLILTLFSPFNLQAHYIFAVASAFFVFISLLDLRISGLIIIIFLVSYLQPARLNSYFLPARRTYKEMDRCFQKFCSDFKSPVFVSVISKDYPYHFGPEFRYLMEKNDCDVKSIEKINDHANYMTVVLDNGSYSDKSRYYELDLFGKHHEVKKTICTKNLGFVLLTK